ncbi:MAG: methyltransferase domain-containing protein [Bacteroidales bacterium]|nr:methyltransferase domain-containing protein [Bacteroidales bacterium]
MNPSKIIEIANAFYQSGVLFSAIDANIFNELHKLKKASVKDISAQCNINLRAAELILDACAGMDLLNKENGLYSNSEEAELFLIKNSPNDLSKAIKYNQDVFSAWCRISKFVKTGNPVEKPEIHLGNDEERTRNFVYSMHGRALGICQTIIPYIDLKNCRKILDIGGGPGTFSVLLSKQYPKAEFIVNDLPSITRIADELIVLQKAENQVKTLPGSYHEIDFPENLDAILFFGMLHQESQDSIEKLFYKAFHALRKNGKVYVFDMMTDESHTSPLFSVLFAVNMALTTNQGWVFSDKELMSWLKNAGFSNFQLQKFPPPVPHWLMVAEK